MSNEKKLSEDEVTMPVDVSGELSVFDRFATKASNFVSKAWFFLFCVLLVVLWIPSYFLLKNLDTWQLIINTLTTIVTFLLVALLQNTQKRSDDAIQQKLNAISEALADMIEDVTDEIKDAKSDAQELRASVGLEDRESSDEDKSKGNR